MDQTTLNIVKINKEQMKHVELLCQVFAGVFEIYQRENSTVKAVVENMCKIMISPTADADEKTAALYTLVEALFPTEARVDFVDRLIS